MPSVRIADTTIPDPQNNVDVMHENGSTKDIISVIMYADQHSAQYTKEFAQTFTGDVYDITDQLYHFVQNNITYKEDPPGVQWIKSPAQLWSDKIGDCKSFSIFIGSVLKNLGIRFVYRFVSFTRTGDVSHVYIVAYDNDGNEIILDAVPPMQYNEEHPDIKKVIDKKPHLDGIAGIGNTAEVKQNTDVVIAIFLIGASYLIR